MGHFKNLEITKESEFVPEQETTMTQPEIPKVAPRETKVWGQGLFGKKPKMSQENLDLIAKWRKSHDERINEMLFPNPDGSFSWKR